MNFSGGVSILDGLEKKKVDDIPLTLHKTGALERVVGMTPEFEKKLMENNKKIITLDVFIGDYVKKVREEMKKGTGSNVILFKVDTGGGKTSLTPVFLYRYFKKLVDKVDIRIVEPTVINTLEISKDIDKYNEDMILGKNLGITTGNRKANQRITSSQGGVVFMTTKVLYLQLMDILLNRDEERLEGINALLIDEVHKTSVDNIFLLYIIREINRVMPKKKLPLVLLMSATMNEPMLHKYFDTPYLFAVKGLTYPIKHLWCNTDVDQGNLEKLVVDRLEEVRKSKLPGFVNTLIFVSTGKEIDQVVEIVKKHWPDADVFGVSSKLYREMDKDTLKLAFDEPVRDRILVATEVMETGVSIKLLSSVLDIGMVNFVSFVPEYGFSVNKLSPINKMSAIQRRGRTGRSVPGNWYPLYTEKTYDAMVDSRFTETYTNSEFAKNLLEYIKNITVTTIDRHSGEVKIKYPDSAADIWKLELSGGVTVNMMIYAIKKLHILGFLNKKGLPTFMCVWIDVFKRESLNMCAALGHCIMKHGSSLKLMKTLFALVAMDNTRGDPDIEKRAKEVLDVMKKIDIGGKDLDEMWKYAGLYNELRRITEDINTEVLGDFTFRDYYGMLLKTGGRTAIDKESIALGYADMELVNELNKEYGWKWYLKYYSIIVRPKSRDFQDVKTTYAIDGIFAMGTNVLAGSLMGIGKKPKHSDRKRGGGSIGVDQLDQLDQIESMSECEVCNDRIMGGKPIGIPEKFVDGSILFLEM
mgnify:CR=1 FL=1